MKNKGFSLTELLIVVAIIAILATIALPSGVAWMKQQRLKSSTLRVYQILSLARIQAIKLNKPVAVKFDRLSAVSWIDSNNNLSIDTGEIRLDSIDFYKGVEIVCPDDGILIVFNRMGMRESDEIPVNIFNGSDMMTVYVLLSGIPVIER